MKLNERDTTRRLKNLMKELHGINKRMLKKLMKINRKKSRFLNQIRFQALSGMPECEKQFQKGGWIGISH